jgi:hypothetical protein
MVALFGGKIRTTYVYKTNPLGYFVERNFIICTTHTEVFKMETSGTLRWVERLARMGETRDA